MVMEKQKIYVFNTEIYPRMLWVAVGISEKLLIFVIEIYFVLTYYNFVVVCREIY